jgi:hypothetical protein
MDAVEYLVLVLKKIQGSVWSEAGRTPLCPTVAWLAERYGSGQYELRLQHGLRVLCICKVDCKVDHKIDGARTETKIVRTGEQEPGSGSRRLPAATAQKPAKLPNSLSQREEEAPLSDASWLRAGNGHAPARTVLRGTVPGLVR